MPVVGRVVEVVESRAVAVEEADPPESRPRQVDARVPLVHGNQAPREPCEADACVDARQDRRGEHKPVVAEHRSNGCAYAAAAPTGL